MNILEELAILKRRLATVEVNLKNTEKVVSTSANKQGRDNNSIMCDTDYTSIEPFDIVKIIATRIGKPKCIPYSTSGYDDAMIGVALEGSLRCDSIRVAISGVVHAKVDGSADSNEGLNPYSGTVVLKQSDNAPLFFAVEKFTDGAEIALVKFASGSSDSYDGQYAVKLGSSPSRITINGGKVIAGLSVVDFAGVYGAGIAPGGQYVYAISYYGFNSQSGASWYVTYGSGEDYPDQSKTTGESPYWAVRTLLATLIIEDGIITKIKQEHFGEIHIAGRAV